MDNKGTEFQKINSRYRLLKVDEKFYVVDYANAKNLKIYFMMFTYKNIWSASEISKVELKNNFKGFHPKKIYSPAIGVGIGLMLSRLLPDTDLLPNYTLSLLPRALLLLGTLLIIFFGVFLAQKLQSKEKTWEFEGCTKVRICSRWKNPIIYLILLLTQLLMGYGFIYSIFLDKQVISSMALSTLFLMLMFIFMKFVDYPVNDKKIITVEKVGD